MTTEEAAVKPRSRNRQATEDALVSAAAQVFSERGYENATTRTIAEAAGCSEGLIQRYFNGKEGLLLATLRDRPQEAAKLEFFERPLCASVLDDARETITQAAIAMGARGHLIRIVISRTLVDPAFCKDFSRVAVRPVIKKALLSRLRRYAQAGLVDPAIDLPAAVELLMGINFQLGFLHPVLMQTSRAEVRRLIEHQALMFARAVAPVAAAPVRRPRAASTALRPRPAATNRRSRAKTSKATS